MLLPDQLSRLGRSAEDIARYDDLLAHPAAKSDRQGVHFS
jgi:hypothetical protein